MTEKIKKGWPISDRAADLQQEVSNRRSSWEVDQARKPSEPKK